eukprot:CFRG7862T1
MSLPAPTLMTAEEYSALPDVRGSEIVPYVSKGISTSQYGELYLPESVAQEMKANIRSGIQVPVVVLIHGGCYLEMFDKHALSSLAAAIASELGYIVYAITYRRLPNVTTNPTDDKWLPEMFDDIALAVDHLNVLKERYPQMDLNRLLSVGHSAGGHLALWVVAREMYFKSRRKELLRSVSPHTDTIPPLRFKGVVSLAGIADLRDAAARNVCDDSIPRIMGGTYGQSEIISKRYDWASPSELLPLGVHQVLIHGACDQFVPQDLNVAYVEKARASGDTIDQHIVDNAGHFEIVLASGAAWELLKTSLKSLF